MPFLRFLGSSVLVALLAAIVAGFLGLMAGQFSDYHGYRSLYGFGWSEIVTLALFTWAMTAFWVGYGLGGMRSYQPNVMRTILVTLAVVSWLATTYLVGKADYFAVVALLVYTIPYAVFGGYLGDRYAD